MYRYVHITYKYICIYRYIHKTALLWSMLETNILNYTSIKKNKLLENSIFNLAISFFYITQNKCYLIGRLTFRDPTVTHTERKISTIIIG